VGYDTAWGRCVPSRQKLVIDVASAFDIGLLYLRVTQSESGAISGTVNVGTRRTGAPPAR
jgi:hypothetical protein